MTEPEKRYFANEDCNNSGKHYERLTTIGKGGRGTGYSYSLKASPVHYLLIHLLISKQFPSLTNVNEKRRLYSRAASRFPLHLVMKVNMANSGSDWITCLLTCCAEKGPPSSVRRSFVLSRPPKAKASFLLTFQGYWFESVLRILDFIFLSAQ